MAASSRNLDEWFDFHIYAFAAIYFAPAFFPKADETMQYLPAAAVFVIGFPMRPVGGWIFGKVADRQGRKASPVIIGLCTSAAGIVKAGMFPAAVRALGVGFAISDAIFGGLAEAVAVASTHWGHETRFFAYLTMMMLLTLVASAYLPDAPECLRRALTGRAGRRPPAAGRPVAPRQGRSPSVLRRRVPRWGRRRPADSPC